MVTSSLSERHGAGPGRSKVCWIMGDPFITSSTIVKMVVRTVAFSSICSALLVEVWLGCMRKSIIGHECSKIWLMKPAKKYHKSGFTVSFMHFPSQLLLLLSQSRLSCEAALRAYDRFSHES